MLPCPNIIRNAFIRPRTHPGITRCPATQSSDPASAQATPASVVDTIKAGTWRMNAIENSTTATIAIAIEVIAFAEIRCLRYGRTNTAPANDPTPTHVKTRPSWAAEQAQFSERDHGQKRWDDRDNKRKEHVPEKDDLHALRVASVPQRTDERFREVFAQPGRLPFAAASTAMMTRATTRNASALNEMSSGAPSSGSRKPPRAGPTIPERFSCTPPSVIAEGSSSLLTMSGTMAPQTGAPKASPIPSAKMQASTELGLITSVHAPRARSADASSLPQHSTHDHNAPVHDVSNSAGWQREEKERSGGSSCHAGRAKTTKRQDSASTTSQSCLGPRRTCPTTGSPATSGKTRDFEVQTKSRWISYSSQAREISRQSIAALSIWRKVSCSRVTSRNHAPDRPAHVLELASGRLAEKYVHENSFPAS